ncbi:NADH:flavin oxidoreductase/NADH oxidase family protein [Glaciecola petra]|uniref:NADH:flavin oxidoreductase/NADH oxidase family protein n=1 Tax=Glaciecola petra TaxID=3075602 RepID=A0ABU2ZV03_9ALTE|nr:NADH:flavin oxidoreductase/NADH oxidase family protein [Aestuariibacter sp. P117]MDT0596472.1 NADH:flavin oxidoreductase/NADH oxidase family protein [Aestuariibacter sp. P117]
MNAEKEKLNVSHAKNLYDNFQFKEGQIARNRYFKSAMSEQLGSKTFSPSISIINVYKRWAKGGVAILVTGNVMVDRNALGEPKNIVLDEYQDLAPFKCWAKAVTDENKGTHIWMQLNHPGKQSPKSLSPEPVAPSAVALGRGLEAAFAKPRALENKEIREIIRKFAASAALAKKAGFTGVQIHGAHGYLVSQFLSPHHNKRNDEWGGDAKKRQRFALEIYKAIREKVGPEFLIGIKMNSADFQKGGFESNEAYELIQRLSEEGIDHIEISGGNYESPAMTGSRFSTLKREAYFLEFAEKARKVTDVPLAVTGGFRSVAAMEAAIASKDVDFIGLARPLVIDPELPLNAATNKDYKIDVGHPTSGFKLLDNMFMLKISWYETQISRIGKGKNPKLNLSAWWTILSAVLSMGSNSFKKRRVK